MCRRVRRSGNNSKLFVSCTILRELWHLVRDWIGVSVANPYDIADHLHQFTYLSGESLTRRSFLQLLWLLCVWVLWFEYNNRLFKNTVTTIHQLVEKVKIHSYWWMKASNAVYVLWVHSWLACPLVCLGIG